MNSMDIAKGIIFKELEIKKDSFEDRLISQKKVYLLETLGVDLGYTYNWYKKGPYSPNLTTYVYNNLEVINSMDYSEYSLKEDVTKKLNKVNSLSKWLPEELNNASWYELLASVLYICENARSWGVKRDDKNEVYAALIKYKPQFRKEEFDKAYDILVQEEFIRLNGGGEDIG